MAEELKTANLFANLKLQIVWLLVVSMNKLSHEEIILNGVNRIVYV